MGCTAAIALGIDGSIRLLSQIGYVDRTLARLLLQRCPGIGWPTETDIARDVAQAEESLLGSSARIKRLGLVGPIARQLAEELLVLLCANTVVVNCSLIAVVHNQHRHIVVAAFLIEFVDVFGNNVAIDDRCAQLEAVVACKLLGVHLAHLGYGVLLKLTHIHMTIHLSHLLVDKAGGAHYGSALADAGTEQALGQR